MKVVSRNKFLLILLIFYINFPFYIDVFPELQKIIINVLLFTPFFLFNKRIFTSFFASNLSSSIERLSLSLYFLVVFCSISELLINQTNDFSYLIKICNVLFRMLKYCTIYIFIYKFFKKNNPIQVFLECFVISSVLHVISSLIMLFFPTFKNFWLSLIVASGVERFESITEYLTRWGLSGFSGFIHTFYCSLAIIFLIFLSENFPQKRKKYFLFFFFCLLGTMFYGRIGLLSSIVSVLCYVLYKILLQKRILLLLGLGLFSLVIFIAVFIIYIHNEELKIWIDWAFAPFINFFETGEFGDSSSSYLVNFMFFLPSNKTLLLGDGRYTNNDGTFYMHTDSGYMRPLLYFGIVPLIFLLFFVISAILSLMVALKKNHFKSVSFFGVLLLFQLFFFEFKGETFQSYVDILFVLFLLSNKKSFNKKIIRV